MLLFWTNAFLDIGADVLDLSGTSIDTDSHLRLEEVICFLFLFCGVIKGILLLRIVTFSIDLLAGVLTGHGVLA